TQIDGGFLSPGTPYYLRLSAINSVGVGAALGADTEDTCGDVVDACSPRAPPPPPTAAKVYANTSDSLSLLVAWDAPTDYYGANVSSYIVEFAPSSAGWTQPYVNFSVTVEDASGVAAGATVGTSAYATVATFDADDVVCGEPWAVRVRAVNEMGEGPPEWY
ncbi:unnamed protein product, partial [Sphacelaria rigidula]